MVTFAGPGRATCRRREVTAAPPAHLHASGVPTVTLRQGDLDTLLRDRFGRRELLDGQHHTLELLLRGRSCLLVAPAGWGGALCWQLHALLSGGQVLVIAATETGLERRVERLARRPGLVACHLDGSMPERRLQELAGQLRARKYSVALVPVRHLADPRVRSALAALRPALVVIEQADQVGERGRAHDPSYLRLPSLVEDLGAPPVLALSEPASADAREQLRDRLHLPDAAEVLAGLDRPELRLEVRNTPSRAQRDAHLLALMREGPRRAVIYVAMRAEVERLALLIEEQAGLPVQALHGGIASGEFAAGLRRFREGAARVLVATGTLEPRDDWPDVPVVVHYALPDSLEQYRRQLAAARSDTPVSVLLYDRADRARLERAAWGAAPEVGHLLALDCAVRDLCENGHRVTYASLVRMTGLHPQEAHIGIEALCEMGAVAVRRRGDDRLVAEPGKPPSAPALEAFARRADAVHRARLRQAEEMVGYARSRGCRRRALADALGYELQQDRECRCDRCGPPAPRSAPPAPHRAYPVRTRDFAGWALGLYRSPGEARPSGPGRLMHDLKYEGQERAADRLAWLMAAHVRERAELRRCDLIVPIPPTDPADSASPATRLAGRLSHLSGIPIAESLISSEDRARQKDLSSRGEKESNIRDTFEVVGGNEVKGRRVLLVDDIFDSGATLQEAGTTLRRAGAAEVHLLTAVRTTFGWRQDA